MGHAQSKRERLEQITELLLTSRSGITAHDIAERLGCHISTVYRLLEDIQAEHGLVETEYGRYTLDPSEFISNVKLHPTETLSIYLALRRYLRQTTDAPDFMVSALRKVGLVLRHPQLTEYLVNSSVTLQEERGASLLHTEIWRTLIQGWLEKRVVQIDYVKPDRDARDRHLIEPLLFEPAVLGHGTYLVAWSQTRNARRIFKLNRIQRAVLTDDYFEPDTVDIEALLRHAWGIWFGEQPITIELLFSPEVAGRVQETMRHPSERYALQPDGSLYWTVEVAAYRELLPWIQGWGAKVKVLGPEALRREVAAEMRAAAARYEEEEK
ncbi:MAG: WYL domain-containing protein [Anaerolineae bacterium]|nr:WYL domain-containing protein [Anaerolineae bacterium]